MFTDCKYTDIWKRWNGLSSVLSTAPMNISDTIVFPFLFLSIVFDTFVLFEKRKRIEKGEFIDKEISKQRMISIESFDQMKFDWIFFKKGKEYFLNTFHIVRFY